MLVSIVTLLATTATTVFAVPIVSAAEGQSPKVLTKAVEFHPEAIIPVKMCLDAHFQGACVNVDSINGHCDTFSADKFDQFNDAVSSIQTDGRTCAFFKDTSCKGGSYTTNYDDDLNDGSKEFNDIISSWRCN